MLRYGNHNECNLLLSLGNLEGMIHNAVKLDRYPCIQSKSE